MLASSVGVGVDKSRDITCLLDLQMLPYVPASTMHVPASTMHVKCHLKRLNDRSLQVYHRACRALIMLLEA